MKTRHCFAFAGVCPVNGAADAYAVELVLETETYGTEPVTTVEEILAWCADFHTQPRFQEDFTRALAAQFTGLARTTCKHGPVHTECEAQG